MFWKIYFFIQLFLLVCVHAGYGFPNNWRIADFIITIIALMGLFGLAWEKKIFISIFWKIFLAIFILWQIYLDVLNPEQIDTGLKWLIIALIILIPFPIALFIYAFKRDYLWE